MTVVTRLERVYFHGGNQVAAERLAEAAQAQGRREANHSSTEFVRNSDTRIPVRERNAAAIKTLGYIFHACATLYRRSRLRLLNARLTVPAERKKILVFCWKHDFGAKAWGVVVGRMTIRL